MRSLFIFCVHLAAALAKYNSSLSGASHHTEVRNSTTTPVG